MPHTPKTTSKLEATLVAARDRAAQMEAQAREEVRELERALRLARGTGDVHAQALRALHGPHWIGDETDTAELSAAVESAITERPLTLAQIGDATGARRNRISGVLVKLQLHGKRVENLGDGLRAIWHIRGKRAR